MKRFKNILFFADATMQASPALERAVSLATANDARLTVIDVLDTTDSPPDIETRFGMDLNAILQERRREALEQLVEPFIESDTLIYTQVMTGVPFVEVIRAVQRNDYDLVIKAARSPADFAERLFGSTDMHLLRKCPCPVWIDRPAAVQSYRNVLAAVDPMDPDDHSCARLVMDLATSLARRESAQLSVIHAWQLYGESMLRHGRGRISEHELEHLLEVTWEQHQTQLNTLLADYGMQTGDPEVHLLKGPPAKRIHELSEDIAADLIVMGTLGRTGIPGFFIGNTAEEVLQTATASILAVKPADFISPVTAG